MLRVLPRPRADLTPAWSSALDDALARLAPTSEEYATARALWQLVGTWIDDELGAADRRLDWHLSAPDRPADGLYRLERLALRVLEAERNRRAGHDPADVAVWL